MCEHIYVKDKPKYSWEGSIIYSLFHCNKKLRSIGGQESLNLALLHNNFYGETIVIVTNLHKNSQSLLEFCQKWWDQPRATQLLLWISIFTWKIQVNYNFFLFEYFFKRFYFNNLLLDEFIRWLKSCIRMIRY